MRNTFDKIKSFIQNNKNTIFKSLAFVAYIVALAFLFILIINLSIVAKTNDNIYTVNELIKVEDDFDCILILGAGIKRDGSPTDMLYDRLCVGDKAFDEGKSNTILISGDSEDGDYTETDTMYRVLNEEFGVHDSKIISDGYGLSTYESLWRAKNVYGFEKVLIITQKYHLHRAIYIADKLGLQAYGIDGGLRQYGKQPVYSLREYFARIKDMIFGEITPAPTYTEKWEAENE